MELPDRQTIILGFGLLTLLTTSFASGYYTAVKTDGRLVRTN